MAVMHSLYREGGTVHVDETTCIQCGQFVDICPAEVLYMQDGRVQLNPDAPFGCIACGHCMMICPTESITVSGRGIAPEDVVPLPPPQARASADALEALMLSRRSVRHFDEREVAPESLERIVRMAASGPMGIPPWDVGCVAVAGRDKVRGITAEIIKGYQGFLQVFRPCVLTLMRPILGHAKYEMFRHFVRPLAETYVRNYRAGRDVLFYDAPALLIFHHSPYVEANETTLACTYAMLAAESLGLGSCIIGGAPPILQRNRALCARLGIPETNTPATALILGYSTADFKRAVRRRFTQEAMVPPDEDTPAG